MNYTCVRVFGALGQFRETRLKYLNGLGYTDRNAKSSTPHLTTTGVFQFGHGHLGRNREIYSWIKIYSSKKLETTWIILINDLFCFVFFSIKFLNLKTDLFWSIVNMWFHIIGSYTSDKINHSNRIDCPKYQTLFRHKSHMTAELYLVYISGIQTNWKNWKKYPKQPGIHRKHF